MRSCNEFILSSRKKHESEGESRECNERRANPYVRSNDPQSPIRGRNEHKDQVRSCWCPFTDGCIVMRLR